ncbi:MAG: RNA pseudouridine synthase [Xanthobacteraceae bacterium]
MTPEEMVSRLLYRDGLMLVIDKPAGMAVHRGSPNSKDRNRESIEDHFDALRFGLPRPPALAHRLDRDTSGCLILGRHRKALAELGKLFRNGAVGKTYWAVVEGGPDAEEGTIDLPLGRLDDKIGWWMKHDPAGQPALTKWKVMGRTSSHAVGNLTAGNLTAGNLTAGNLTWLELDLLTGRTHQIRVHCAEMGWPVLGDGIYGHAPRHGGPPLHLHARQVAVPLYKNRPPICVCAPVPAHMREMLLACGWDGVDKDASTASEGQEHPSLRATTDQSITNQ